MTAIAARFPKASRHAGLAVVLVALLGLLATVAGAQTGEPDKKIALVIGNSAYENVAPLRNPANDAADIAAALETAGFAVELHLDMSQIDLLRAFQGFQRRARLADMAVVYYAGHGMEIDKRNYLIPVGASLKTDRDVVFEAVPLDTAIFAVEGARQVSLVIVDACRDNPFAAAMVNTNPSRSIGRGLALVEPEGNTLVAYAAREGTTAADGSGRNSPYAAALLEVLEEPGVELGKLFRRVRDQVISRTNGAQVPFVYGSLSAEDLYLHPPQPAALAVPEPAPAPAVPMRPAPASDRTLDGIFWASIAESTDPRDFEDYLATFPDGLFTRLAERRLAALRRADTPPVSEPTPETPQAAVPKPIAPGPTEIEPEVPVALSEPQPPAPAAETAPAAPETDAPLAEPQPDLRPAETSETAVAGLPRAEGPEGDSASRLVIVTPEESAPALAEPAPAAVLPDRFAGLPPRMETAPFDGSRARIRLLQQQLNLLGFDAGYPDGLVGPRTRGAAQAFQVARGLPATGRVDADLAQALDTALSPDRAALYLDRETRYPPGWGGRLAELTGTYCLFAEGGAVADGRDGAPVLCHHVRPIGSSVIELATYFQHLRNARGNAIFPVIARARRVSDGVFAEEDGSEIGLADGVLKIAGRDFVYSALSD